MTRRLFHVGDLGLHLHPEIGPLPSPPGPWTNCTKRGQGYLAISPAAAVVFWKATETTRRCEPTTGPSIHALDRRRHHHDHHLTPSKVRQKGGPDSPPPPAAPPPQGGVEPAELELRRVPPAANEAVTCPGGPFPSKAIASRVAAHPLSAQGDHLFTCLMGQGPRNPAFSLVDSVDVDTTPEQPIPCQPAAEESRGHPTSGDPRTPSKAKPTQCSSSQRPGCCKLQAPCPVGTACRDTHVLFGFSQS
ncbi:hypothetical protein F5X68DRAFT_40844 [Plectosphaerella plurivora]|uniref:Uncharacterized protein n=1 Tax=Plectosphaerella plurivora TaxID=936078 RepID=A0A9P9A6N9_9PEZI|nr:hypothetical protein F5X68DRAFT_40844 [Plectosphaerella plurivora]